MRYPVDVYTGKIQAYPEGKPSAIAKIQVDGELMLTELGLEGDEQAEKRFTAGQTERCVIILVSTISTGCGISGTGGVVCCACVWRKSLNRRSHGK